MKNILRYTLAICTAGLLPVACTSNFDEYNTDPYALYKGDPAVLIPTMLDAMMYVQQNDSQMVDQMVGSLGGYFTLSNRWGGQNFDTFNASDAWNATPYNTMFEDIYANFFDIDIEEKYRTWTLPALSLQPLIGNAVKHNTITRSKPFHISIRTENGWLVVSNPKVPKLEPEPSTGIGLENLRNRWHLITGRDIEIIDTDKEFVVRMPLHTPLAG